MPRLRRQRGLCRCHVRFHPGDRRRISSQIAFLQLALDRSSLFSRIVAEEGLRQAFSYHPCEEFRPGSMFQKFVAGERKRTAERLLHLCCPALGGCYSSTTCSIVLAGAPL